MKLKAESPPSDVRRRRARVALTIAMAGLMVLGTAPTVANAVTSTQYANGVLTIQNQVLSSNNYTVIGGSVFIVLPGNGWYGIQHGRTVAANGNLGGTYSEPNVKINWTNPQASSAHADCWWTWVRYDGYKGDTSCWVTRP